MYSGSISSSGVSPHQPAGPSPRASNTSRLVAAVAVAIFATIVTGPLVGLGLGVLVFLAFGGGGSVRKWQPHFPNPSQSTSHNVHWVHQPQRNATCIPVVSTQHAASRPHQFHPLDTTAVNSRGGVVPGFAAHSAAPRPHQSHPLDTTAVNSRGGVVPGFAAHSAAPRQHQSHPLDTTAVNSRGGVVPGFAAHSAAPRPLQPHPQGPSFVNPRGPGCSAQPAAPKQPHAPDERPPDRSGRVPTGNSRL